MKRWKILHQHLIKCGGTSLNSFLDTQYYANRVRDPEAVRPWFDASATRYEKYKGSQRDFHQVANQFWFKHYDCVHGHNPMNWLAPEDFSRATVLREPISRVLSQIRDWKRLDEHDQNAANDINNNFRRFCKDAPLGEIIKNYSDAPIGARNLSNMQAKLLSASHLGLHKPIPEDEDELLECAIKALDDFDVLGLTEEMPDFYRRLCCHMGWCPPRDIEHRNRTNQDLEIEESDIQNLKAINRVDLALYQEVSERFSNREGGAQDYDTDAFEIEYATNRTGDIAPFFVGDRAFRFDFNMPIIGNGLHGRDAPNTSETAVWTGPSNCTTIFFPVIPLASMTLQFGIKGYADESLRSAMQWWVDGVEREYRLVPHQGVSDCAEITHIPERDFVRVDIKIPNTVAISEDFRKRGISLLWYGYKL